MKLFIYIIWEIDWEKYLRVILKSIDTAKNVGVMFHQIFARQVLKIDDLKSFIVVLYDHSSIG